MHDTQQRFANPDAISLDPGQGAPCSGAAALERSDNLVKVCALTPLQFAL